MAEIIGTPLQSKGAPPLRWLLVGLAAHTAWGLYPVLARFLQTRSHLPTLALAGFGNAIVLVGVLIFVLPHVSIKTLRSKTLWVFAGVVVCRSLTNLLSARYTLAIYVQLVNLLTPFFVAFISRFLYKEKIPPNTGAALVLSVIGAALMTFGQAAGGVLSTHLTPTDYLGLGIAFLSSIFLAFYMILLRRSTQENLTSGAIFFAQISGLTVFMLSGSFITGESLAVWGQLGLIDWVMFFSFILVALLFANVGQITALKHITASNMSNMLAWRLVSTWLGGMLILGERLVSVWQYIGALVLLVTITWYISQQGNGSSGKFLGLIPLRKKLSQG